MRSSAGGPCTQPPESNWGEGGGTGKGDTNNKRGAVEQERTPDQAAHHTPCALTGQAQSERKRNLKKGAARLDPQEKQRNTYGKLRGR